MATFCEQTRIVVEAALKHAKNIVPNVSRVFTLPLETLGGKSLAFDPPVAESAWHPLPDRFLEGIELVSRFTGSAKGRSPASWKLEFVHVLGGKVIATNNKVVVEYIAGECDLACTLTVKQARMIKAFGQGPTHATIQGETIHDRKLHLKWKNGNRLAFPQPQSPADELKKLFSPYDWDDLSPVEDDWQSQVIGHFSFKPVRDNDGLMSIYPDRITGG
ncbi:MAG: hypothetical protein KDK08_21145 [Rhizobiaceae bacterium]|nr:hypothetical protein [Rhizobiaceae bacterium]